MQLDAAAKLLLDDMPKIPSDSPQYKASLIDSFHRLSIAYENMKARTKMQPHLLRNPDAQLSQFRELLRVYRDTVRIQRYSDTRAA